MSFEFNIVYSKSESSFYEPIYGNYKFDTDLNEFGIMKERKFRKTNRLQSVLKLREVKDSKSIYPMLDEYGYSFMDFFIFKSTWDLQYHIETFVSKIDELSTNESKRFFDDTQSLDRIIKDWEFETEIQFGRRIIK
jgi:hypothetical protein